MLLTMKDQQRIEAIQALTDAWLTVAQAAHVLGLSERQVWRRLARAYRDYDQKQYGTAVISHRSQPEISAGVNR